MSLAGGEWRGGVAVNFDGQVKVIQQAGYPASLNCVVVQALFANGIFLDHGEIECVIFP